MILVGTTRQLCRRFFMVQKRQRYLFHSWLHCYIVLHHLPLNKCHFSSWRETKWRKMHILFHAMMKNGNCSMAWNKMTQNAYFVSRHDEKWQLFNGVKQNDAKRASCPTPKLWSKYQFLHYLKALKAVSRPESIQQCSQRWNKVTCSMVSDKTLRNHHFGELLDL